MTNRAYPRVASVTTMIPMVAQGRLLVMRGWWWWPWRRQALYWLRLGMGIEPERAEVDLDTMTVKHTIP